MNKKNKLSLMLLAATVAVTASGSGFAEQVERDLATSSSVNTKNQKSLSEPVKPEEKNINLSGASENYYLPYMQIGGTRFFNVSVSDWAAGVDLFVPLFQVSPSHLVFTHLRFYDRTGKPFEGNAHFGYRYLSQDETRLHGIYGAFDRKRSVFGNYFNQLTFGVETWYKNWFIGANFYQPIGRRLKGTRIVDNIEIKEIKGNLYSILVTPDHFGEKAAGGGDAEIGYEFFKGFTGYAGGYYFKADGIDAVCGPRARLSYDYYLDNGQRILKVFDKIGLEAGIQHDKPRGDVGYLSLNFKIGLLPNHGAGLSGVARHMVDFVRRDVDIITSEAFVGRGTSKDAVDPVNGKIIKFVSGGPGTNVTDLEAAKGVDGNVTVFTKDFNSLKPEVQAWIKKNNVQVNMGHHFYSPHSGRQLSINQASIPDHKVESKGQGQTPPKKQTPLSFKTQAEFNAYMDGIASDPDKCKTISESTDTKIAGWLEEWKENRELMNGGEEAGGLSSI
jgi:hypothetical protein